MGWTSYNATYYKNGSIDRKSECDAYWSGNNGQYTVLKSAMVGSTYYAAVRVNKEPVRDDEGRIMKDNSGAWIMQDVQEPKVFAAVFLTSTNMKDYYNFSYKDMDESCIPDTNCPAGILKLLTPTTNENALAWRAECQKNIDKKKSSRKDPHSLANLPYGATIKFKSKYNMTSGLKAGDPVTVVKTKDFSGKTVWKYGYYRWKKTWIPEDYEVVEVPA